MPAQIGTELLRELRNARHLPPYHAERVDAIAAEVNEQFAVVHAGVTQLRADSSSSSSRQPQQSQPQQQPRADLAGNLLVHKACMLRNKRCALAYLVNRLRRLERMRWEEPAQLLLLLEQEAAAGQQQQQVQRQRQQRRAGASELEWLARYDELLAWYGAEVGLDLTVEMLPPKELYIEVRVLQDCGTLVMEGGGEARLEAGTMHYLPRRDVEPLIRAGKLAHVAR